MISSFCYNPLTVPTVLFRALLDNWSAASLTCNIQYARYNKYVLAYCGVSILGRTTCVGRMFLFLFVSFFCVPYSFVVPLCFFSIVLSIAFISLSSFALVCSSISVRICGGLLCLVSYKREMRFYTLVFAFSFDCVKYFYAQTKEVTFTESNSIFLFLQCDHSCYIDELCFV